MGFKRISAAIASIVLLVVGFTPSSAVAGAPVSTLVEGFIVAYKPAASALARDGEPTGSNLIPVEVESRALGGNLYSLSFQEAVNQNIANRWLSRLRLDSRIESAEFDFEITSASIPPSKVVFSPMTLAKAASAPSGLKAKRSTAANAPMVPRLRLSWLKPERLYGAQVVGYRIQYSQNSGATWQNLVRNTRSSETVAFVSDGLVAGVKYRFRVRAITSDGSGNVVGAASLAVSASPRTTPKPVALTTLERTGDGSVEFVRQSKADRGGFGLSLLQYVGVAKADGYEDVLSTGCSASACEFVGLQAEVSYRVEIFASNPRGTTSSNEKVLPSDELFPLQWHLNGGYGVSMPQAWNYAQGKNSVVVAVIDSGIVSHPELESAMLRRPDGSIYGYDFVSSLDTSLDGDGWDTDPTDMGGDVEGNLSSWHGTHVSGIVAAQTDSVGVTGVAPNVKILPVRALGSGKGSFSDLLVAINWAAGIKVPGVPLNSSPAKVINLSLGSVESATCRSDAQSVINSVLDLGISVVVAAGNGASNASGFFPANCTGVITVGATSALGDQAAYSNFGPELTISAPGGDTSNQNDESAQTQGMIVSTWIDNAGEPSYGVSEGTSMAAPIVSGIVALMYSVRPSLTPSQVRSIVRNSYKNFVPGGVCATSAICGSGIIDAHLALARVSALN